MRKILQANVPLGLKMARIFSYSGLASQVVDPDKLFWRHTSTGKFTMSSACTVTVVLIRIGRIFQTSTFHRSLNASHA